MTTSGTQSDTRLSKTEVFRHGNEKILAAHPEILDALIAQAKKGSYQHAKFLFDLLDVEPAKPAKNADEEAPARPSLAEYLLERLQLMDPEGTAATPCTDGAPPV